MTVSVISPTELAEKLKSGTQIDLIDVRTPMEYQEVHATIARNVPLDQLDPKSLLESRNGRSEEPLYVICRSGSRGRQACEKFIAAGFENIINVDGGTQAWEKSGLDVVRGRKVISLERQVRIAAGALAFTGAVLALTVNVWWVLLSGFVGAGLMFAGITDTCGMGLMLARMPWNKVKDSGPACST